MHGSVEGLFYTNEEIFGNDLIIKRRYFGDKIDYTALGHIHNMKKLRIQTVRSIIAEAL
jgi:hypothetical protein